MDWDRAEDDDDDIGGSLTDFVLTGARDWGSVHVSLVIHLCVLSSSQAECFSGMRNRGRECKEEMGLDQHVASQRKCRCRTCHIASVVRSVSAFGITIHPIEQYMSICKQ